MTLVDNRENASLDSKYQCKAEKSDLSNERASHANIVCNTKPHLRKTLENWELLQRRRQSPSFEINGVDLHITDIVATAYKLCTPTLPSHPDIITKLERSVDILKNHLAKGHNIYGVNTGFGGSADSRTKEVVALQAALMQLTQAGILNFTASGKPSQHVMPSSWVRATILVRCNATVRGHSAVTLPVLQAVINLLKHKLTPVVPLRGSISASGDLMPLSYIAGTIEGNPDIYVELEDGQTLAADEALQKAGIEPVTLGPKEGLGLVNGTACSAALGALVINEAHQLAFITQALTAMAVEALHGTTESFNAFIGEIRPHPGQIECAQNISSFLHGSQLARDARQPKDYRREDLIQDRYSLRTASQWIGPYLEDLLLADQQVTIELNSSCDNPLIDIQTGDILCGGNFQATSVTSAMEKTRLALQSFGRILFAQLTEIVDPNLSRGLPANLAADNPSLSFTMKGVEISMASYMAELSYFANPMSSHVQATEMHNQSINSMALASARMTMEAIEILSMMCACSLYACCQGLDLRVLHSTFIQMAATAVEQLTERHFSSDLDRAQMNSLNRSLRDHFSSAWELSAKLDIKQRCEKLIDSALPILLSSVAKSASDLLAFKAEAIEDLFRIWTNLFTTFLEKQNTADLLGEGSKVIYQTIRYDLGVPFHSGLAEHPTTRSNTLRGRPKKTIGGWISIIHDAIKTGRLYAPLMASIKEKLVAGYSDPAKHARASEQNGVNEQ